MPRWPPYSVCMLKRFKFIPSTCCVCFTVTARTPVCSRLEALLVEGGGTYFTGFGLSYADLVAFQVLFQCVPRYSSPVSGLFITMYTHVCRIRKLFPSALESFPALAGLTARVAAIPSIAAYVEKYWQ